MVLYITAGTIFPIFIMKEFLSFILNSENLFRKVPLYVSYNKFALLIMTCFLTQHGYYGRTEVIHQLKSYPLIVSIYVNTLNHTVALRGVCMYSIANATYSSVSEVFV